MTPPGRDIVLPVIVRSIAIICHESTSVEMSEMPANVRLRPGQGAFRGHPRGDKSDRGLEKKNIKRRDKIYRRWIGGS